MAQDGARELVVAEVALKSQLFSGFDRIGAEILQLVGAEFVHQADASAFLEFVNDDSAAFGGNVSKRDFELGAAITAKAVEYVAGEALRVNAHERRGGGAADIPHNECGGFFDVGAPLGCAEVAFEAVDTELSVFGGEIGFGRLAEFELILRRNKPIIMNTQA
jgi:hypothetical protein